MEEIPLHDSLRRIVDEEPSFVGELAYTAEEELSRAFGKLMCAMHGEAASADELLSNLEAFGDALHRVGQRYARVTDYYHRLHRETLGYRSAARATPA